MGRWVGGTYAVLHLQFLHLDEEGHAVRPVFLGLDELLAEEGEGFFSLVDFVGELLRLVLQACLSGWVGGWVEEETTSYSNTHRRLGKWVGGWVDGWEGGWLTYRLRLGKLLVLVQKLSLFPSFLPGGESLRLVWGHRLLPLPPPPPPSPSLYA